MILKYHHDVDYDYNINNNNLSEITDTRKDFDK